MGLFFAQSPSKDQLHQSYNQTARDLEFQKQRVSEIEGKIEGLEHVRKMWIAHAQSMYKRFSKIYKMIMRNKARIKKLQKSESKIAKVKIFFLKMINGILQGIFKLMKQTRRECLALANDYDWAIRNMKNTSKNIAQLKQQLIKEKQVKDQYEKALKDIEQQLRDRPQQLASKKAQLEKKIAEIDKQISQLKTKLKTESSTIKKIFSFLTQKKEQSKYKELESKIQSELEKLKQVRSRYKEALTKVSNELRELQR